MNPGIFEEASEWFVSFRAGDVDGDARVKFDAWMRTSPEHLRAYLEAAAIWNEGPALDANRRYSTDELVAMAREEPSNVVAFPGPLLPPHPALERNPPQQWQSAQLGPQPPESPAQQEQARVSLVNRRAALAACFLVALVGGLFAWSRLSGVSTYETGLGEHRTVTLSDGSVLELNTRSRVRFRATDTERRAELLEGQALFRVAHDAKRPFTVSSESTEVRAVGTEFDVKRRAGRTVVTVVEGRVAVSTVRERAGGRSANVAKDRGPFMLSAGHQLTVANGAEPRATLVDVAAAIAWTDGRLVFEDAPLAEVVEEFNRYNRRQIVVGDIGISRITAAFSSTDSHSLVNYFRQRPGVAVTETEDEIRVMRQ